jgi:hypothetical protein
MLFSLTLALAVFRVLANHPDHSAPMNDLALHANFLYRCPDFHRNLLRLLARLAEAAGLKTPALRLNLNLLQKLPG